MLSRRSRLVGPCVVVKRVRPCGLPIDKVWRCPFRLPLWASKRTLATPNTRSLSKRRQCLFGRPTLCLRSRLVDSLCCGKVHLACGLPIDNKMWRCPFLFLRAFPQGKRLNSEHICKNYRKMLNPHGSRALFIDTAFYHTCTRPSISILAWAFFHSSRRGSSVPRVHEHSAPDSPCLFLAIQSISFCI
jgi:hypothetical protein